VGDGPVKGLAIRKETTMDISDTRVALLAAAIAASFALAACGKDTDEDERAPPAAPAASAPANATVVGNAATPAAGAPQAAAPKTAPTKDADGDD
jgi:hypothetical protein